MSHSLCVADCVCLSLQVTRRTPSFSGCPGPTQTSQHQRSPPVKHTDSSYSSLCAWFPRLPCMLLFFLLLLFLQICLLLRFFLHLLLLFLLNSHLSHLKAKLSPKCNLGFFFCECIRVKPLCKCIIMTKEALFRFTIFSFSGQTHFQWECYGHYYDSIKIAIFKTLRRLDTTWIFACSITRVSTYEQKLWVLYYLYYRILYNKTSVAK